MAQAVKPRKTGFLSPGLPASCGINVVTHRLLIFGYFLGQIQEIAGDSSRLVREMVDADRQAAGISGSSNNLPVSTLSVYQQICGNAYDRREHQGSIRII
ncbi:hypothetical protein AB833_06950 [Chromatiales bacterium (ex Bugula neritina AB1)]|nr:hypothetical protein AB833_06950 [Chromatiales bacterium (ex Bugula neritina AB1)]